MGSVDSSKNPSAAAGHETLAMRTEVCAWGRLTMELELQEAGLSDSTNQFVDGRACPFTVLVGPTRAYHAPKCLCLVAHLRAATVVSDLQRAPPEQPWACPFSHSLRTTNTCVSAGSSS